jgi:hypothetical protein
MNPPEMRALLAREVTDELARGGHAAVIPEELAAAATIEGIASVVSGTATLTIVNPSAALTLAYRGSPPFGTPQPVRTIAVMPTQDAAVLVVHPSTGLRAVEEIARRKPPLRVGVRGRADHSLHHVLADLAAAAGFSLGELRPGGGIPEPGTERFRALVAGELDAVFDEGIALWLDAARAAGMTVLPLAEPTLQALERRGYRRAEADGVPTIDFSGWPLFVHSDCDDALARAICAALDARRAHLAWDGDGPFPLERAVCNTPDAPYDVPLHPAAERYWRERGYRSN